MVTAFGKIRLISGNAEFLADRARARAIAAVTAEHPDCEVSEASAIGLQAGQLAGLTSASLFSDLTALVLTDLRELGDAAQSELLAYCEGPSPDIALVLVHGGGAKGKGMLDKLRKLSAVSEVKLEALKYDRDFVRWVHCDPQKVLVSPAVKGSQQVGDKVKVAMSVSTTEKKPCVVNPKTADLLVVISANKAPVWDSDVCKTALLTKPVEVSPQWTTVVETTWSGRGSGRNCSAAVTVGAAKATPSRTRAKTRRTLVSRTT